MQDASKRRTFSFSTDTALMHGALCGSFTAAETRSHAAEERARACAAASTDTPPARYGAIRGSAARFFYDATIFR